MHNLENVYEKYNTDKGNKPAFEDLNRFGHRYGDFYNSFFEKYIGKNPSILEIGVFEGESMLAHNDYFNNDCTITGIDAANYLKFDTNDFPNIELVLGYSENEETFNKVKDKRYDIILDDASHTCANQIHNLKTYSTLLKPNGIYILEDLHSNLNQWYTNGDMNDTALNFLLTKRQTKYLSLYEYIYLMKKIKHVFFYSRAREFFHTFDEEKCSITSVIEFNE